MDAYKEFKMDVSQLTDDEYWDLIDKRFQDRPDGFLVVDDERILVGPEARLEELPEVFRSLNIEYMADEKHEKPVKWDHPTLSGPTHSTTVSCNEGSYKIYVDNFYTAPKLFHQRWDYLWWKRFFHQLWDQKPDNRMIYDRDLAYRFVYSKADGDRTFDSSHRLFSTPLSFKEGSYRRKEIQ